MLSAQGAVGPRRTYRSVTKLGFAPREKGVKMTFRMVRTGKSFKVDPELVQSFIAWADRRHLKVQDALDLAMHMAMALNGAQCGRLFDMIDQGKPFRVDLCEAGAGENSGVAGQNQGAKPNGPKRRDAG